ncbi:MAG: glucose-6-phosphate 1-dehydrogenase [Deltaproteobacteria bacterium]|jgi:6-phosphogluconate dehydrogenase|nr:glucose-6-phosphate 1-dehydrogenase [Deltaproteobacteria bacterium]
MKIGYVGLGKMGFNMVERLLELGYQVVAFDPKRDAVHTISKHGAEPTNSLEALAQAVPQPRLVWLMVPYQAVDNVIAGLLPFLSKGDTLVDGGNSPYKQSIRRAREMEQQGIAFLDAGVSGGPAGARKGACIMVGGREEVFQQYEKLFRDLSVKNGYGRMGSSGAGHFVKMVHNGIEYGMMQAIAEGFALLKSSPLSLNLVKIADVYNHKSVIESRLVGWLQEAFQEYGDALREISGSVDYTGEGYWTVEAAKELGIPVPVIKQALSFRVDSHKAPSYTGQLLSAMRHQFGGHEVFKKGDK